MTTHRRTRAAPAAFVPVMFAALILCTAAIPVFAAQAAAPEFVWIEAESPTRVPAIKPPEGKPDDRGFTVTGWGNVDFMSGGKVLSVNLSAEEAPRRLPEGGAIFAYDFDAPSAGDYEVWARIGFEWIRSDFDWRIDDGLWATLSRTQATTDIVPIQTWNELAWIMLGRRNLAAGKHTLQLRHLPQTREKTETKTVDGKRQDVVSTVPDRTLHYTDAFCVIKGAFRPNGKFKPGEAYQTPADQAAAAKVYQMPGAAADAAERVGIALTGPWQIARWDEDAPKEEDRLQAPDALPDLDSLHWYAVAVPGDRDALRPEMAFAHRYIYRTRINVPADLDGRAFLLEFENFNMIAAVFVNGAQCGWSRAHSTEWACDVTAAVRPGRVNELAVVFKDAYYAIRETADPHGLRRHFNLPPAWLHNQGVSMKMDMPVVWDTRTGILEPVTLTAAGQAYAADVFAQPSVAKKQLALEITVNNPGPKAVTVSVANEIVPWNKGEGGPPAKTFASRDISITAKAAETVTVAEPWADPRLWWPDDPHLYCVVTKVSVNGRVVDVKRTRFGFREWTWDSLAFRLNGVPWQMWAECDYGPSPEAWLEKTRTSGMNMMRYWRRDGWGGKTRRQVLDLMDERGMPVRNSGVFDGEHAAYGLVETVDGRKQPRWDLFDNWTEQMRAWIRAERNHPSVFIWSIENEIVYINANNFGNGEVVEPAIRDAAREVMKWDPTRPVMVDGGRALRDGSLPVNGCHYNDESGCDLRDYPDAAYDLEHWYDTLNRNAWPMVRNRPMLHGECFYANGWTPAKFATIGGERCFIGMAETAEATGWYARMLSEGWRWAGVSAWHFWFGEADRAYYQAWQPVAAFCRQWNWTFAGGSNVPRTLKVFNGTRHADPITLAWTLTVGGKEAARGGESLQIPPGEAQQVEITLAVPKVADRTAGEFVLTCSRGGKEVYRDAKAVAVIDPAAGPKPAAGKADLVVLDPKGPVKARLAARGIAFTEVATVDAIPEGVNVLVVGPDAVPADRSADPMWLRLAAAGAKILVLDQAHPLHYQALPADLEPTEFAGRIAFSEDLTHPAFAGLEQKDFFTWSGDHVVYRAAYKKGSRGARSLLQCDFQLDYTALAECPVNDGVLVLCQAAVGTKLAADPVAQRMFDNLLAAAAAYAPVRKTVALAVPPDTPRGRLLRNIGLTYDDVSDPVEAVGGARGIAVVDATPANLKALAGATDKVRKFTDAGGWLMLWNVGPEGLADFNRIVGVEHLLRPFRPERVLLATPRDPLTSGLTLRDVVMEDPEKINAWMAVRWAADDAFTHVVDLTDIAPFAALPTPEEMGKGPDRRDPRSDHWPPNMVNGFTAADTWRYCYSILLDDGHATKWTLALPREESITNFSIVLNTIYHRVTKINLYFDDDPKPFVILTRPDESRQDFAVDGRKAKRLTIELAEWEKSGRSNVIGIDNLWIGVARSDDLLARVRPLLNIGGLVRYQMGAGGVVLCQLNIPPAERLPLNAEKKAAIAKVVLRNLGAAFQGGRTVVVGEDLACRPVAIPESAFNAYLTRKGKPAWFPGKGDLSHLPAGENRFAGVVFRVLDFATSPVPSCIMLKGHQSGVQAAEVAGIPVGRRAAALFFLHTYNPQRRTQEWQPADDRGRTRPPLELFRYVVHYADGQTADVPVFWRQGVAGWLDADPRPLIDAAVAWAAPFAGDDSGAKAVLYAMQWTNPRPDEPITHINVTLGPDGEKHGAPAVLAITAAEVRK